MALEAQKLLEQLDSQTQSFIKRDYGWLEFERKVEEGLLKTWVHVRPYNASISVYLYSDANNSICLTHVGYRSKEIYDKLSPERNYIKSPATVRYISNWVDRKVLPLLEKENRRLTKEKSHIEKMRQKYLP